ncbi:MAG: hypothetical protein ABFC94_04645 [Syntrophomonas sp.]
MLYKLLPYLFALVCLAYYVHTDWPGIKNKPVILGLLIAGAIIFITGQAISGISIQFASLLRLFGACLFFTGVAINTSRRQKKDE